MRHVGQWSLSLANRILGIKHELGAKEIARITAEYFGLVCAAESARTCSGSC